MKNLLAVFDEKSAERMLKLWAKERKTHIVHYISCARFNYSGRLFWAIFVKLFGWESSFSGVFGFHVYEDGEVKLISRQSE